MGRRPSSNRLTSARKRTHGKRNLSLFLVVLLCLLAVFLILTRDTGRILPQVSVVGQMIGGLTINEATQRLDHLAARESEKSILLLISSKTISVSPAEIGARPDPNTTAHQAYRLGREGSWGQQRWRRLSARWTTVDLPLLWQVDSGKAEETLERLGRPLTRSPRNARARLVGERVEIVPEQHGQTLDVVASRKKLQRWLQAGRPGALEPVLTFQPPPIRAKDLQDVDAVIARYRTTLAGSSANRRHNIHLAAKAIDGLVLMPGDVFSYDAVVGPRTPETGYRTAPVLIRGELVPGTGGGACQVSTTLYNVALLSNMEILKRSHHSMPVAYVPAGRDATVSAGLLDLRFRNRSPWPIVLRATVVRSRLSIVALGNHAMPPVRIQLTKQRWLPAGSQLVPDATLPRGMRRVKHRSIAGRRVTVLRVVGEGPEATTEVISRDYYRPWPAIILLGTRPEPSASTTVAVRKD